MTAGLVDVHDHAVQVYDDDDEIVAGVAQFVREGLGAQARVIVIATPEHRQEVEASLRRSGTDVAAALRCGDYLPLDAAATMAGFMAGSVPDAARFAEQVGALIDAAGAGGRPVRAYGEMVALLWDAGAVDAALTLEAHWNDLAETRDFTLLCGYRASALGAEGQLAAVGRVCDLHSSVVPPRSYAAGGPPTVTAERASERAALFMPVPVAVAAVRRFVVEALSAWGRPELVHDASVVASELSTNAIRHAASPFRVSVSLCGAVVRVAVEDVGPAQPQLRAPGVEHSGGRGVAIVAQLSERWGYEEAAEGKIVWAELGPRDEVARTA